MVLGIILTTILAFFGSILSLGRRYFQGSKCKIQKDLTGNVIIVTGANTGVGKETVRELAKTGATIILACRNQEKGDAALREIQDQTQNKNLEVMLIDLADLKSIKNFAEEFKRKYKRLDVLINNASNFCFPERETTKDGFERTFGVNYFGTVYLTSQLLDVLKASAPSRIVIVGSMLHLTGRIHWDDLDMMKQKYHSVAPYCNAKLCLMYYTRELQERLEQSNVKVVILHPGGVNTPLYRHVEEVWWKRLMLWTIRNPIELYFWKNANQGAQTSLQCALEDFDKLKGGSYYKDCKPQDFQTRPDHLEERKKLFDLTEGILAEKIKS